MHELRDVITLHHLAMVVGIGTGQLERFGAVTILVDMGKERTGICAIVATTAEHYPLAIA